MSWFDSAGKRIARRNRQAAQEAERRARLLVATGKKYIAGLPLEIGSVEQLPNRCVLEVVLGVLGTIFSLTIDATDPDEHIECLFHYGPGSSGEMRANMTPTRSCVLTSSHGPSTAGEEELFQYLTALFAQAEIKLKPRKKSKRARA